MQVPFLINEEKRLVEVMDKLAIKDKEDFIGFNKLNEVKGHPVKLNFLIKGF